ncbi:hypothetical protein DFH09DRAFT_1069539 [Mycena vulgaris]|nr:hypothetical protein DFH09DRAFT_1069539 [Mycena vulgaris]
MNFVCSLRTVLMEMPASVLTRSGLDELVLEIVLCGLGSPSGKEGVITPGPRRGIGAAQPCHGYRIQNTLFVTSEHDFAVGMSRFTENRARMMHVAVIYSAVGSVKFNEFWPRISSRQKFSSNFGSSDCPRTELQLKRKVNREENGRRTVCGPQGIGPGVRTLKGPLKRDVWTPGDLRLSPRTGNRYVELAYSTASGSSRGLSTLGGYMIEIDIGDSEQNDMVFSREEVRWTLHSYTFTDESSSSWSIGKYVSAYR